MRPPGSPGFQKGKDVPRAAMARGLLNAWNRLLNAALLVVLAVMGAYAGFALWDNQQIYATASNVQAELLSMKPVSQETGSTFDSLRALNPDVQAWLTMDETAIDYPVLYGTNNFAYLNTDVYGNFSLSGSIFLDSRNDPTFADAYNLVHGHHMANRLMFGDLDLYKDPAFFEENRTGTLILPDRSYSLRTFACMVVSASDEVIFAPDRWGDDIDGLLVYARVHALHADDAQIERLREDSRAAGSQGSRPQIIALARCSSEYSDARTILLAEMTDFVPVDDREDEEP